MLFGAMTSSSPAERQVNDEKTQKITEKMSGYDISAAILARRRRPVASGIALDPLRWSMCLVTYRRTDRSSETADKYGTFRIFLFKPVVRPGQYGPNTCPMAASSGFA
jgi:hypothetical protein